LNSNEPPPLSDAGRRLLAEGDSWFTLGSLKLAKASNVLNHLVFATDTAIVSCAYPGDTLKQIAVTSNDPEFDRLLRHPRFNRYWEAILLSGGGNDLIDAAQQRALNKDGTPAALDARVLLTPDEAALNNPATSGPARYVSNAGWDALAGYLKANVRDLVTRRDEGISAGRPLFMHTYHVPTVYPSGTVGAPEGWLYPTLRDYGIPLAERQGVAEELFQRLRLLLLGFACDSGQAHALPHVYVFDSAALAQLTPADPQATGVSGDWVNEIHPTPGGYRKIGRLFGPFIEEVLTRYP
jgi:hypothetical protein